MTDFRGNEYLAYFKLGFYSFQEIAEMFGVSVASVKAQTYWWVMQEGVSDEGTRRIVAEEVIGAGGAFVDRGVAKKTT